MSDASANASDPAISAWVSANAGSGTTYTLANRVARLLLADAKPQKILCLTFTRAAAAEMQDRLFRQLGEWAMLGDSELSAKIADIGGTADDLPKARRLFAQALETPGRLKVLTLHAFCQIVLSRFPLEAGVTPSFEVLEEQTAREMIAEARQHVLERAGAGDAALAAAVTRLAVEAGEFRMTQILDSALGGDRRRLDRLLANGETPAILARRAHGVPGDEDEYSIAVDFCGLLAQDITILEAAQGWLAAGGSASRRRWRPRMKRPASRRSTACSSTARTRRAPRWRRRRCRRRGRTCWPGFPPCSSITAPPMNGTAPPAPPRWRKPPSLSSRRCASPMPAPSGWRGGWTMTI